MFVPPFCEVLFEEVLQALKGDGRRISVQAAVVVAWEDSKGTSRM